MKMKKFENKTTELRAEEKNLTYNDLIRYVVNQLPQGGFTPEEMRSRMRILDALNDDSKEIELEDADASLLKTLIKSSKWMTIHQDILDFEDCIKSL
jgi:hypothetical protein